jgi:hypothetical protein
VLLGMSWHQRACRHRTGSLGRAQGLTRVGRADRCPRKRARGERDPEEPRTGPQPGRRNGPGGDHQVSVVVGGRGTEATRAEEPARFSGRAGAPNG